MKDGEMKEKEILEAKAKIEEGIRLMRQGADEMLKYGYNNRSVYDTRDVGYYFEIEVYQDGE